MGVEQITQIIQTVGFPITMCIGFLWFIYQLWKQSVTREDKLMVVISDSIATLEKYAENLTEIKNTVDEIKQDIENLTTS